MLDLLSPAEDAEAAQYGWGLHYIFDLSTDKWEINVLPIEARPKVSAMARAGAPLPTKALRLISQFGKK